MITKKFQQFPINPREIHRLDRTRDQYVPLNPGQTSTDSNESNLKLQLHQAKENRKQKISHNFDKISTMSTEAGETRYNSNSKFNLDQYQENSPEWQLAILRHLVDMKENGHYVQEIIVDKVIILFNILTWKGLSINNSIKRLKTFINIGNTSSRNDAKPDTK